ncbi:MAG: LysR family transcriptional regulator [Burkholderiales bacterium]
MDNLADMATFARVVEAKSFSTAAQRLRRSKSVVSKHVSRLERALGARLLNRTTRKLSLTEVGAAFYEHCARMLAEAEAAELAVGQLRAAPRGLLKVSAPIGFGRSHIAAAIPDFLHEYHDISVDLILNDRVVDLAEDGLDLAIRLTAQPAPNLVARRLASLRWVVCATPRYLKRHGTPQKPEDLARHNCLHYSPVPPEEAWRFKTKSGEFTMQAACNLKINNSEAIHNVVLADLGIGLLPTFVAGGDLQTGKLKPLLTDYALTANFPSEVYAVYLSNRFLSPKVRAFVDFLVERFSSVPYWDRSRAAKAR